MPLTLREVPDHKIPAEARDHMRTHVYVRITVTDRKADDTCYMAYGYRVFAEREAWYSASDTERESAIQKAAAHVAKGAPRP
ncbi:hypothetical protein ACWGSA_00860 [Streptomyces diastaticus]